MKNKYLVVRANSTTGPYIVERNQSAPGVNQWSKADIADYCDTKREAECIAKELNQQDKGERMAMKTVFAPWSPCRCCGHETNQHGVCMDCRETDCRDCMEERCMCVGCCAHSEECSNMANSGQSDEAGNPVCAECLPHTFTGALPSGCNGECGPYEHPYFADTGRAEADDVSD